MMVSENFSKRKVQATAISIEIHKILSTCSVGIQIANNPGDGEMCGHFKCLVYIKL